MLAPLAPVALRASRRFAGFACNRPDRGFTRGVFALQARLWYRKSAELGDDVAMKQLGKLYEDGHGVPKSSAEARKWYERAKRQAEGR
jgi:TPR repeat protein